MPLFRYQALDAQQQVIVGRIEAEAVTDAIAQLETAGLAVRSIGFAAAGDLPVEPDLAIVGSAASASPPAAKSPDAAAERALLEAHLSAVLVPGRAIVPALRAYAAEMPAGRRRRQLQTVCRILESGNAADAAREMAELPEYWIPLLSAAASSNDAGRVLREFLDESQRTDELSRQAWQALAYPALVLGLAGGVLVWFAFLIVPGFREIFQDFGLQLPTMTRAVVNIAEWITSGQALTFLAVVAGLIALLFATRLLAPTSLSAWFTDRFGAVFGRSTAVAQFARFTADLLEGGVSVPSSIRIAGTASRRSRMRRAGWSVAHALESGDAVQLPADARVLTSTVVFALRSDIALPARVRLLKEVSLCYAERTRDRYSWTRGLVEPLAIGAVGVVVGIIVLALFVPLVELVNNLSG